MQKPVDTRYQSKHATLVDAKKIAETQSKLKHGAAFGIIEDKRENIFYVEEDYSFIRNFEVFHGEYLDGKFLKPDRHE